MDIIFTDPLRAAEALLLQPQLQQAQEAQRLQRQLNRNKTRRVRTARKKPEWSPPKCWASWSRLQRVRWVYIYFLIIFNQLRRCFSIETIFGGLVYCIDPFQDSRGGFSKLLIKILIIYNRTHENKNFKKFSIRRRSTSIKNSWSHTCPINRHCKTQIKSWSRRSGTRSFRSIFYL